MYSFGRTFFLYDIQRPDTELFFSIGASQSGHLLGIEVPENRPHTGNSMNSGLVSASNFSGSAGDWEVGTQHQDETGTMTILVLLRCKTDLEGMDLKSCFQLPSGELT